jgi:hypothetical protein
MSVAYLRIKLYLGDFNYLLVIAIKVKAVYKFQ